MLARKVSNAPRFKRKRSGTSSLANRPRISRGINSAPNYIFTRTCYQNLEVFNKEGFRNVNTNLHAGDQLSFTFSLDGVIFRTQNGGLVGAPMAGFGDLTALFDQYKILKIDVECRFSTINTTPSYASPLVHYCLDYNDSAPTSIDSIQQYSNSRRFQLGVGAAEKHKFRVVPKINLTTGSFGGLVAVGADKPMFINCTQPNVEHFGCKLSYDGGMASDVTNILIGVMNFEFIYTLQMKTVR
jgi:hypothetical protein